MLDEAQLAPRIEHLLAKAVDLPVGRVGVSADVLLHQVVQDVAPLLQDVLPLLLARQQVVAQTDVSGCSSKFLLLNERPAWPLTQGTRRLADLVKAAGAVSAGSSDAGISTLNADAAPRSNARLMMRIMVEPSPLL